MVEGLLLIGWMAAFSQFDMAVERVDWSAVACGIVSGSRSLTWPPGQAD